MAVPLIVMLLGGYVVIGLVTREYNWRTRAVLLVLTFGAPAWFYFLY